MLNADFFFLCCTDWSRDVDKLSTQVSILINLFLGEVSGRRQANLSSFLNTADDIHGHSVVASQNFVNLDVVLLGLWSCWVPSNDLLSAINASHHVEHLLVINVVEEPDIGLFQVFFEGHSVAISHLELSFVAILTTQGANNSLASIFGHSVVMIDDGKKYGGVDDNLVARLSNYLVDQILCHLLYFLLTNFFSTNSNHLSTNTYGVLGFWGFGVLRLSTF